MSLVTDADLEKLMASLHRIDIKGEIHLVSAINVAMVRMCPLLLPTTSAFVLDSLLTPFCLIFESYLARFEAPYQQDTRAASDLLRWKPCDRNCPRVDCIGHSYEEK